MKVFANRITCSSRTSRSTRARKAEEWAAPCSSTPRLIRVVIDWHLLRLYTNAAMRENLILYHRLGYQEDDRRGEDGFERVFLSKRLDAHLER
jgi:hypothetical protein